MTQSSFYVDGGTYATADAVDNTTAGSTTPSQAPSSFYPAGTVYNTLADSDTVLALMQALRDDAAAHDASAATHDASAATSAINAATSATNAASAVQAAAGTANPLMDGTAAVGTGTKWAHEDHVHPTDSTRAPLASPGLTGTPTAPTAAVDTNTTQLATTAFVLGQGSAVGDGTPAINGTAARGTSTHFARADHVHPTDTSRAPLASPALTGTPTAPTAAVDTNTTQLATTAFVLAQASAAGDGTPGMNGTAARGTSTHFARADHVHPVDTSRQAALGFTPVQQGTGTGQFGNTVKIGWSGTDLKATVDTTDLGNIAFKGYVDAADALKAPLASPALTGTPTAPTAAVNTNTTQLATTAFVLAQAAAATPLINGAAAVGTATKFAREDHVHPTDTTRLAVAGNQTVTGGFKVTPNNIGTVTTGTTTPDPTLGNYQFYTNNGAHTLAAPANDCAIDILITNGATAGSITFSGFTVSSSTGDPLTTVNASKFLVSIRRLNGVSTYLIKALQ